MYSQDGHVRVAFMPSHMVLEIKPRLRAVELRHNIESSRKVYPLDSIAHCEIVRNSAHSPYHTSIRLIDFDDLRKMSYRNQVISICVGVYRIDVKWVPSYTSDGRYILACRKVRRYERLVELMPVPFGGLRL